MLGATDAPTPPAAEGVQLAVHMRDTALLELLYGSGLRIAEATGLDVDEVDLTRARVVVWGKGAKQRTVPLSDPAVAALGRWLGESYSLPVVPDPDTDELPDEDSAANGNGAANEP